MRIRVLGFLALSLSAASIAANAQSETLFYTGNDVASVPDGPLSVSGNINGYITLAAPLGDNLSYASVIPTSFSFNGGTPLSSADGALDYFAFSTNSSGKITDWEFAVSGTSGTNPAVTLGEGSENSGGSGLDVITLDYTDHDGVEHQPIGYAGTPGQWSVASAVSAPEMDPTSAFGSFMLLLGTVAVLRGGRANTARNRPTAG
jgi:hypothetical protein